MYDVLVLTNILVYPNSASVDHGGKPLPVGPQLTGALSKGFEIISAVPFSTEQVAGIEYVLRKPLDASVLSKPIEA